MHPVDEMEKIRNFKTGCTYSNHCVKMVNILIYLSLFRDIYSTAHSFEDDDYKRYAAKYTKGDSSGTSGIHFHGY